MCALPITKPRPTVVSGRGYRSGRYAAALGRSVELPASGGHLVVASVEGGGFDAAGPYPILVLESWHDLARDLDDLAAVGGLLSVVAVTDPFADLDAGLLGAAFGDHLRPWKDHHVVDLEIGREQAVDARHRRNVRKASVDVEQCDLTAHLDDWVRLYDILIARHAISGTQRFSAGIFSAMALTPGLHTWRAVAEGTNVGMVQVMVDGDRAWYHLGAFAEDGYRRGASFALFWHIMGDLVDRGVRWFDLGASAGTDPSGADDGLDRFKRGWATATRPTWLGGRILDPAGYAAAVDRVGSGSVDWFPRYRAGRLA